MKELLVLYRACGLEIKREDYKPLRVPYFSKYKTFKSFAQAGFNNQNTNIIVLWDGPENEFSEYIQKNYSGEFVTLDFKSNKKSLDYCFQIIHQLVDKYTYFFIVEEDHFYLPGSHDILIEGLRKFSPHFIALGDNIQRYWDNNGDVIRTDDYIGLTKSKHWRVAESYMMSVAFCSHTFRIFKDDMVSYNVKGENAMHEREFFRSIIPKGFRLFTPMPALSTHAITVDLSPCVDWEGFANKIEI